MNFITKEKKRLLFNFYVKFFEIFNDAIQLVKNIKVKKKRSSFQSNKAYLCVRHETSKEWVCNISSEKC